MQVLIDESTQATEPECLIPLVMGVKQVRTASALNALKTEIPIPAPPCSQENPANAVGANEQPMSRG